MFKCFPRIDGIAAALGHEPRLRWALGQECWHTQSREPFVRGFFELGQVLAIHPVRRRCAPQETIMKQPMLIVNGREGAPVTVVRDSHRGIITLQSFPLLALSLGLFALSNGASREGARAWYDKELFSIGHTSGDLMHVTGSDAFLGFSLLLLFIEILRATRTGGESIVNHAFSAVVFVSALVLFLTHRGYGNSTFFLFVAMTMIDFIAGFIITAVSARRDASIQG
jgi:hypothetical protein